MFLILLSITAATVYNPNNEQFTSTCLKGIGEAKYTLLGYGECDLVDSGRPFEKVPFNFETNQPLLPRVAVEKIFDPDYDIKQAKLTHTVWVAYIDERGVFCFIANAKIGKYEAMQINRVTDDDAREGSKWSAVNIYGIGASGPDSFWVKSRDGQPAFARLCLGHAKTDGVKEKLSQLERAKIICHPQIGK